MGERTYDLNEYIETLKKQAPDEIRVVSRKVSNKFELPAVLEKMESENQHSAILFQHVGDYSMPVISNLFGSRKRLAIALGTEEKELNAVYRERENHPIDPVLVDSGPVKDIVIPEKDVDMTMFPAVTHNELDAGAYITAGAMVVKDPETGIRNIGMYRHMIHNSKQLGIHLAEVSHSNLVYHKHRQQGKPMEVAITLGMHPIFYLGILSFLPYGVDEYTVAGGLMQEPLPLVKCETVDLEVPAMAEIVIEGTIDPEKRMKEGPYGEFTTLYGGQEMYPVVDVKAITMRKAPLFLDVFSGHIDQQLLGGTPRLGMIYKAVKMACPTVRDVYMAPSGCCRMSCYIAIEKRHEGEAKNAMCAAFAADPFLKYAVVVDADVDIFNDFNVLRAIVTKVQMDEDVFTIRNAKGHPLDPTARDIFLVGKVGIDATKPLKGYPETIRVPGSENIVLDDYFGV